MNYRFLLVALLLCGALTTQAQLEISASTSLDVFQSQLKPFYNTGHTHLLAIGASDRHKTKRSAWAVNVGYGKYTAKTDTLFTLYTRDYDDDVLGYDYYGDYQVLQLTVSKRWDFILAPHFELFCGVEIGYHYTQYDYAFYDGYISEEGSITEGRIALAPQVGIGIPVHRFCFFAQSRYVMSVGAGSENGADTFNRSLSTGGGVRFRLERLRKNKTEKKREPSITYDSVFSE
jgi:hypothetical protein